MHKLMEKTCEALEDIEKSSSLNIMDTADRKLVTELVDLKKNILKIQKLEDEMEGYSEDGGYSSRGGRGGGSSYANRGQHYVRGHYSRDGGSSYDGGMDGGYSSRRGGGRGSRGGYSRGNYSRDSGEREEMMKHLRKAIETAPDDYREDMEQFMMELQNG